MAHTVQARLEEDGLEAEYAWGSGRRRCAMYLKTTGNSFLPADGSLSQFITEHYWGYAAQRDGGCLEYEVQHPRWLVSEAADASFSGDAVHFYGREFAGILLRPPDSSFLAGGSAVSVFRGRRIE
jgi:hypothetical protein